MKQKLYFIVVLSTLIAICLPLTAVAADEPAAEPAATQAVDESTAKPAEEQAVEEAAAQPAAESTEKQAVEEPAAKPTEEQAADEPAAKPAEEQAEEEPAAKPAHALEITRTAICRQVVDREPVDEGASFESPVEKLYCFTEVIGAQDATEIYHVWYFAETERAVVTLKVNGPNWRTYSSKIIQPHEIGDWRVDVLGPEGDTLKRVPFKITP
jgi:hypothetical protein